MDRLTARSESGFAYWLKCFEEPCYGGECKDENCSLMRDSCEKLATYEVLEQQGLLLRLPCTIGQIVYVDTGTLSIQEMEFEEEDIPKHIKGRVISFRINSKEKAVKIGVQAKWWKEWFDNETGPDGDFYETERLKSYPISAFGKTVFLTYEAAERALAEQEVNFERT